MPNPVHLARELTRIRWALRCRRNHRRDLIESVDILDRAIAKLRREADAVEMELELHDPARLAAVEQNTAGWKAIR